MQHHTCPAHQHDQSKGWQHGGTIENGEDCCRASQRGGMHADFPPECDQQHQQAADQSDKRDRGEHDGAVCQDQYKPAEAERGQAKDEWPDALAAFADIGIGNLAQTYPKQNVSKRANTSKAKRNGRIYESATGAFRVVEGDQQDHRDGNGGRSQNTRKGARNEEDVARPRSMRGSFYDGGSKLFGPVQGGLICLRGCWIGHDAPRISDGACRARTGRPRMCAATTLNAAGSPLHQISSFSSLLSFGTAGASISAAWRTERVRRAIA